MRSTTKLRQLLAEPGALAAPGAFDCITARLIQSNGFSVMHMTGGGAAAATAGLPDIGLVTMSEMTALASRIAASTALPVIADADSGYGNALNVIRTVHEYERAGVAGLHLEDQEFPKKCGFLANKQIVPAEIFARRVQAATENRTDPDFLIVARTDARAVNGLDDAIDRAKRYAHAGADMVFIEALQSVDEIERVAAEVATPLMINLAPVGDAPLLKLSELSELGFKVVIYPVVALFAAIAAVDDTLGQLMSNDMDLTEVPIIDTVAHFRRFGLDWWMEQESRYHGA